jgi:hypothetical protein
MVLCPNGAQGDSPGQSEAPPWDWCARNNPSPERAEPAASKPMCYVSPFQGFGELGRRRTQVAGVPRVALRSTLGYLIMPRWGERSRGKNPGTVPLQRSASRTNSAFETGSRTHRFLINRPRHAGQGSRFLIFLAKRGEFQEDSWNNGI